MSETDRILHLEEEVAHLRRLNEELSEEIHKHWKQFDVLKKQIGVVEARLTGLQETLDSPTEEPRPPHW